MSIFGMKGFATAIAALALTIPATAGTIILGDIVTADGVTTFSGDGISVNPADGTSPDGLRWSSVGATAFTGFTPEDLALSGTFTCSSLCNDTFRVDFVGIGFNPGATVDLSIFGTSTGAALTFSGFASGNESLGSVFTNTTGSFNMSSTPILLANPGNFSGSVFFNLNMGEGTVTLPSASTADVFVNDGSAVPEPGTIAILAACILLLIYMKRLRKA
jgi:hypothetical protein